MLCVEFFVVRGGGDRGFDLFVNEIAPRPHNSGHYSVDACVTSQFSQQARIAAGLPLGDTRRHSAAVMLNLLGDLWFPTRAVVDEVTVPGYAGDHADADVDAQATATSTNAARAEAAIADADPSDVDDAAGGDDTLANDAIDDAAAVVERGDGSDDDADDDANEPDAPVPSRPATHAHAAVDAVEPDWSAVLAHTGVNLHLYGKREARRGRKMGHVTIVAAEAGEDAASRSRSPASSASPAGERHGVGRARGHRRRRCRCRSARPGHDRRGRGPTGGRPAGRLSHRDGLRARRRRGRRRGGLAHFAAKGRPADHPLIVHLPPGGDPTRGRATCRPTPHD